MLWYLRLNILTPRELSDVLRLMSKSMIECMLQAEMDVHLSEDGALQHGSRRGEGSRGADGG